MNEPVGGGFCMGDRVKRKHGRLHLRGTVVGPQPEDTRSRRIAQIHVQWDGYDFFNRHASGNLVKISLVEQIGELGGPD